MISRDRNLAYSDASCVSMHLRSIHLVGLVSLRLVTRGLLLKMRELDAVSARGTIHASLRCVKMIANDQFQASSHSAGAVVIFMKLK